MTRLSDSRPTHLRVNDLIAPVGAPSTPYFGWYVNNAQPNEIQTSYQLLVASSLANLEAEVGNVWDSGIVASRQQNHIDYSGSPLTSNTKYYWQVRTWDSAGNLSPYSEAASFTTGLFTNEDWAGANWIKRNTTEPDDYTYYRKFFDLPAKRIERATVFISAVHKYDLYLNGTPIGKGPTYHYPGCQYYNAYDITRHLRPNDPNLFAVLTHWFGAGQGRPESTRGLILKAIIEFESSDNLIVGTDGSWKQRRARAWVAGQPSRNDEGVGYIEKIDAAYLEPNWALAAHNDSAWELAIELGPQPTPPWVNPLQPDLTRIVEARISPASITSQDNRTYLVDLGKVYAGRPEVKFSGGTSGTFISMQGGYTLAENGRIDPNNNQNADLTYFAIANGGDFTFLPHEYLGMRYVQIDNSPMPITKDNFAFIERHVALDPSRSSFTSSNETLNRVWELMKRSIYLGAQEQFLDTPTREKGGFLVDSLNESLAAMVAFGERALTLKSLNEFLHSMDQYWANDKDRGRMNAVYPNGDGPRDIPDFTQAYLAWVWEYYLQTGNASFLRNNYKKFKSIADYVSKHRNATTGLIHSLTGGGTGLYQHGIVDWPPSMRYGYDMATEARTVINALAYADYTIISRIAAELGNEPDRDKYGALADSLKTAINTRLLNSDGVYIDGLYADGTQSLRSSQHANMFPLALGIVPPDNRTTVLNKVKELKMSVGMVTVGWLIRAIGEANEGEHLLDLYTRSDWDGWANSLSKGATCTWESWDADSGNGLSLSHPWGAVGLCGIQQYILGVKPLAPQFEVVQIKPLPFGAKLTNASGRVPTDRGDIEVSWERTEGRFRLTLSLPVNAQAQVSLPGKAATGEDEYTTIDSVASGLHTFERTL